jgi:hypothetical protein
MAPRRAAPSRFRCSSFAARAAGEACDPARQLDVCAAGLRCDGRCVDNHAPVPLQRQRAADWSRGPASLHSARRHRCRCRRRGAGPGRPRRRRRAGTLGRPGRYGTPLSEGLARPRHARSRRDCLLQNAYLAGLLHQLSCPWPPSSCGCRTPAGFAPSGVQSPSPAARCASRAPPVTRRGWPTFARLVTAARARPRPACPATAPALGQTAFLRLPGNVKRLLLEGTDPELDLSSVTLEPLTAAGHPRPVDLDGDGDVEPSASLLVSQAPTAAFVLDFGRLGAPLGRGAARAYGARRQRPAEPPPGPHSGGPARRRGRRHL